MSSGSGRDYGGSAHLRFRLHRVLGGHVAARGRSEEYGLAARAMYEVLWSAERYDTSSVRTRVYLRVCT